MAGYWLEPIVGVGADACDAGAIILAKWVILNGS